MAATTRHMALDMIGPFALGGFIGAFSPSTTQLNVAFGHLKYHDAMYVPSGSSLAQNWYLSPE